MPYIPKKERMGIDSVIADLMPEIKDVGQLNYTLTKIILDYVSTIGLNYKNVNGVIGVLECAKLEMYRRVVAAYENKKKKQNGDVY